VRIQPGVALSGRWLFCSKCRESSQRWSNAESEILLSDNLYWNLAGGRVNSELTIVLNAEHTFSSFCLLRKRCKLIRRHTDPGK